MKLGPSSRKNKVFLVQHIGINLLGSYIGKSLVKKENTAVCKTSTKSEYGHQLLRFVQHGFTKRKLHMCHDSNPIGPQAVLVSHTVTKAVVHIALSIISTNSQFKPDNNYTTQTTAIFTQIFLTRLVFDFFSHWHLTRY